MCGDSPSGNVDLGISLALLKCLKLTLFSDHSVKGKKMDNLNSRARALQRKTAADGTRPL